MSILDNQAPDLEIKVYGKYTRVWVGNKEIKGVSFLKFVADSRNGEQSPKIDIKGEFPFFSIQEKNGASAATETPKK